MSKENKKVASTQDEQEEFHKVNKIPDIEWLFRGEGKKGENNHFFRKLMLKNWWKMLYSTLIYFLQSAPTWIMPLITSDVIDKITYRPEGYITHLIVDAVFLTIVIVQNVPTTMWRSSIVYKWMRTTTAQIRSGVVRKLQRLSITYHKEMEEGRIQSKFLRDIESVGNYFGTYLMAFLPTLIGAIISIIIAIWKSPIVSLFFAGIIPINIGLSMLFRKRIRQDHFVYRQENEKLSSKLTTTLQMLSLTKAHGLVSSEANAVDRKIDSVTQAGLHLDKTISIFGSMMWVFSQLMSAFCLFFCVFLAIKNYITPGEVVLFQSLFVSISGSVLGLINMYPSLTAGNEAIRSLSEIVCAEDIERDEGKEKLDDIDGRVDFCNVSYHYPDEEKNVVQNFNLSVKKGERIAIVGASGSGKSTIINLIIGLLAPTEGEILIDGKPLTDMSLQSYRHFLSVVPQNSILFAGTIRENITYGLEHYTEEELLRAIEDAAITEFLPSFPLGLDTPVGEHGDKLSGGQKQRVCIARALIRSPKILILDEATSALDNVSEYHVQKAIERLVEERTTFIVAHRLSTIRHADRIVVMDEGKIVECGTYDELMLQNGKFTELEKLSRMREEEARAAV